MCGRFSLTTPVEGIRRLFGFREIPNLPARYNIAPTQAILTVRSAAEGGSDRRAAMVRWGLIPSWARDPSIGSRMINARAETVAEKPAFRAAFRRRRCLVPADGFFEWMKQDGAKQPFRIHLADGEPFAFAALWETWTGPDGSVIESCAIVTTDACPEIAHIHDRMPVILDGGDFGPWLDGPPEAAARTMHPYRGRRPLAFHPIGRRVNDVRNDDPSILEAVSDVPASKGDADGPGKGQMSLF